ncbi:MAG: hypothetical protein FWE84_01320 [Firmicutes bacterium]|nr:hypothetical protein [Bacillota bacterium]
MKTLKLTINLLPKGAWGNNLSAILPKKDWDILRQACYKRAKNHCSVCGANDAELDAHEVWDFDVKTKTQALKDIVALCSACHGVKHYRNSERIGYEESAKRHFLKINECGEIVFAGHYAEAQALFEERNGVLRWKVRADLDKFGGTGIEVRERNIPIIINPYEGIDWVIVNHVRADGGQVPTEFFVGTDLGAKHTVLLLTFEETCDNNLPLKPEKKARYFLAKKNVAESARVFGCPLPPRIRSIAVNNYDGTIAVVSDYASKIEWLCGDKVVRTKYNIAGKFVTKFCVEDVEGVSVRFRLTGNGGQACSMDFRLIKAN